jgi:hypothetical protein
MHFWPQLWWILCASLHIRAQYTIGQLGKRHYKTTSPQPLYDFFHAQYQRPDPKSVLAWNMFLEALPFSSVFFLLATCGLKTIPLLAFVHGWLCLLRTSCFSTTLLPDASQTHCYKDNYTIQGGIHCLVFSGHATATLMSATLWTMQMQPPMYSIMIAFSICALQSAGIVYCRKHYTVDVLLAWLIVPLWTFTLSNFFNNYIK